MDISGYASTTKNKPALETSSNISPKNIIKAGPVPVIKVAMFDFRSYADAEFEFLRHKSNYVKGPNGAGKSNIYKAITWAIFSSKKDKPHPTGTKGTVIVKVTIGNLYIRRSCVPDTLRVRHNEKVYKGEDAEETLRTIFGTKKQWMSSCYLKSCIHSFVAATPQQRSIILDGMVENDEIAKLKINTLITTAKTELKELDKTHDRLQTTYHCRYEGIKLNHKLILDDKEEAILTQKLDNYLDMEKEYKRDIDTLRTLKAQRITLVKSIDKYSDYNNDYLEQLKDQQAKYRVYQPKKLALDRATKEVRKYFPAGDVNIFMAAELDDALVRDKMYSMNMTLCKNLKIIYSPKIIAAKIASLEHSLNHQKLFTQLKEYDKVSKQVDDLKDKLININISKAPQEIEKLQRNIKYAMVFERRRDLEILDEELTEVKRKLADLLELNSGEYIRDFIKIITTNNTDISGQSILDIHDQYRQLMETLPSSIDTIEKRLEDDEQLLMDINRSKTAESCPHCHHAVKIVGGKLHKFDGKIVEGNVAEITKRITVLKKLIKINLVPIPEGLVRINVSNAKTQIKVATKGIDLEKQIEKLKLKLNAELIPDDVEEVVYSEAVERIDELKRYLQINTTLQEAAGKLATMIRPVIPDNVEIVDIETSRILLDKLRQINYVEKPIILPEAIRAAINYHTAVTAIATFKNIEPISDNEVIEYASGLAILNASTVSLTENEIKSARITTTQVMLDKVINKISNIRQQIEISAKQIKMAADHKALTRAANTLEKKHKRVAWLLEFRQEYEIGSKECIIDTITRIEKNVNSFLYNMGTDITVNISHENNIKVICLKDGIKFGKPEELSSGEASLVSFGFNIAFSLESDNDILILDEVTDKLSVENKDYCIELLLEIMQEYNKTLLISDHHCHSGDYDNIIEVKKNV
jgi:energy-coupling factor transporter ATP-binding protein EcfA2